MHQPTDLDDLRPQTYSIVPETEQINYNFGARNNIGTQEQKRSRYYTDYQPSGGLGKARMQKAQQDARFEKRRLPALSSFKTNKSMLDGGASRTSSETGDQVAQPRSRRLAARNARSVLAVYQEDALGQQLPSSRRMKKSSRHKSQLRNLSNEDTNSAEAEKAASNSQSMAKRKDWQARKQATPMNG